MSSQSNAEYFAGRAAIERAMSEASTDKRSAVIHADSAARYEELAQQFGAAQRVDFPVPAEPQQASGRA